MKQSKYIGRDYQEEEIDDYEYDDEGNIVYYAVRPNKTQIKKEYAALFALGEQLAKLDSAQLKQFQLPDNIETAIMQVSQLGLNNARKRTLKYIAGQLYKIDHAAIVEQLEKIQNKNAHAVREHHTLERWRDRLLNEGNKALTALLNEYPHADAQVLRQLIRNALKEKEQNKPPKSARALYQELKSILEHVVINPDMFIEETMSKFDDDNDELDFEDEGFEEEDYEEEDYYEEDFDDEEFIDDDDFEDEDDED